jgi:hypothetical protein
MSKVEIVGFHDNMSKVEIVGLPVEQLSTLLIYAHQYAIQGIHLEQVYTKTKDL